jgi:hypothetical protein
MYAHYTATKTRKTVIITRDPSLRGMYDTRDTGGNFVATHEVTGKVDARRVADRYSAVCWNF